LAEKIVKNKKFDPLDDKVTVIGGNDSSFIDKSSEEILKSFIVKNKTNSKTAESKQLEDEFQQEYNGEIVEPPYNPLLWATLMEINTRLGKLIRTYARNTVGLGWKIIPKKTITKKTTKAEKKLIEEEKEKLEEFFNNCNNLLPFDEICFRAKVDEEAMGNGYLEISRNITGIPNGIFHVPGHTIRILKNRKGFVQMRSGSKRYFKIFNGDFDMDMETGETFTKNSIAYIKRANELIPFQIYTPRDSFYGIPRYVSCASAIAGNQLSARRNLAFFKNDATPRLAITVANGQLTSGSISDIKDFVNSEGKGANNAHRVMIIQAKAKNMGDQTQQNVDIKVTPLTVGQTDDASFIKYKDSNDEEIREAFGIGEVFLGSKGTVNRATASILREITNQQEFIPDAKVKEFMINQTICRAFDIKYVKFEYERPSSLGKMDVSDVFGKYMQGGGVTPNDIRQELGKEEYTEDWGDKPLQVGLVEYQMGLLGAQGAVSQGKIPEKNTKTDSNEDDDDEGNDNNDDNNDNSSSKKTDSINTNIANTEKLTKYIIDSIDKMLKDNRETIILDLDKEDE